MLTKNDLEQIDAIMKTRIEQTVPEMIKVGFLDFFENVFEPYTNRNEDHHQEIVREIKKLQGREEKQDEVLKEHAKRLDDLEKVARIKN